MFLTGRLVIVAALGVVPLVLLDALGVPPWFVLLGWLALCGLLVGVDVLAAAPLGALRSP